MVVELGELLAVAEVVEPVVAALAARYYRLGCWDHAWPADPAEPGAVDTRALAASGDDRLRALLTSIAGRANAALEGGHTHPDEVRRHGLTGFGLDG